MGAPVLIGAGIGAISSLATGRDPLQGAVLGGVTGGTFGGTGGIGSGFTEGGLWEMGSNALASNVTIPEIATEGVAQSALTQEGINSSLLSGGGLNVGMGLEPYNMGMGGITASQGAYQAASPFGTVLDIPETVASSGLETGGGYVLNPIEQETAANIAVHGGLTAPPPKQGLFDSMTSSAYDSLANMNPINQVQLAQTTFDALTPSEQAQALMNQPPPKINVGKPLNVDQTGTGILDVKVPMSVMDQIQKNKPRGLFYR